MAPADMLSEILRLPPDERARRALELIRSLDTDAEAGAIDAWDAEIARRGAEVDAGIAETMTVDEYRAHVRQRRAARALGIRRPSSSRRYPRPLPHRDERFRH